MTADSGEQEVWGDDYWLWGSRIGLCFCDELVVADVVCTFDNRRYDICFCMDNFRVFLEAMAFCTASHNKYRKFNLQFSTFINNCCLLLLCVPFLQKLKKAHQGLFNISVLENELQET